MSIKDPTIVRIKRVKQPCEPLAPTEYYVGYLCDAEGNNVDSPIIGEPLYLTGPDSPNKWLFKSDIVWKIDVTITEWIVLTEMGVTYQIETQRKLH